MKRLLLHFQAAFMLLIVFVTVWGVTKNQIAAASIVVGMASFSALMYRRPGRRERRAQWRNGFAFTGIVIPDFTPKAVEDLEKMTSKEQGEYFVAKREYDNAVMRKEIADQIKELHDADATKNEEQIKTLNKQSDDLLKEIELLSTRMKSITEVQGNFGIQTIEQQVVKFLTEKHEDIKKTFRGGGYVEFEVKAVGNMAAGNQVVTTGGAVGTAGSATNPDGIPQLVGVQMAPPGPVNLRDALVENLTSRFSTSLAAYPYTESIPKEGDAAFVAEGAAKPQIDFKIETRYAQPNKVAAWIHLTEESVTDIPGLQSIATGFLRKKHDLRKQRGILFGDGTSPNPKGATVFGRDFVAGDMALTVRFTNFMDVVNAAITDVFTTHNYQDEMPYYPSLVLINPVDFFINIASAKDEFGHQLYPQASLFNMLTIGGVTIMPEEMIPAGKIFVADMSKYNLSDYVGYTVRIGWINDDFIKNQFVILGESRFHAFVKKLDQQAFIYDDIETIKTAISFVPEP